MIGSSKNSTENYPRKCFWTQEKETQVKFNPGLSVNRSSNNWAQEQPSVLPYSGHLRHDYLIKYAYFSKCYLERMASISAPEKWTTNVAQRKKHVKHDVK